MKRHLGMTLASLVAVGCATETLGERSPLDGAVEGEQAGPQDPDAIDDPSNGDEDTSEERETWTGVEVPPGIAGAASTPIISVDGHGGALAVWTQYRTAVPHYALWASLYEPDAAWLEPVQLTEWRASAFQVASAGNAGGRRVVAWNVTGGIAARYYEPQSGWQPVAAATPSSSSGWTSTLRVVMNESGDALVAWTHYDATVIALWSVLYQPSGQWLAPVALDPSGIASFDLFDVAVDDSGRAVSVWAETDNKTVLARRGSQVAGSLGPLSWGPAEIVGTYPEEGSYGLTALQAAFDTSGTATVVWVEHRPTDGLMLVSTRALPDAAFATPRAIVSAIPPSFGFETNEPRIASNMSGDIVALWRKSAEDPAGPSSIVGVHYSPDAGWSEMSTIADELSPPYLGCAMPGAGHMTIGLDEAGDAHVVFESRGDADGTNNFDVQLWATSVSRFGVAAPKTLVATSAMANSAVLAVGAGGDTLVFWSRTEKQPDGGWAQSVHASYVIAE